MTQTRQRDCRSNSAPTSTSRRHVFFLLVCRDQRPRKTVRHTFLQQLGSTLGRLTCLQHVPVRIAPAHIRPSCDHSTGSYRHSLVRCMANHPCSNNLNFFEPMCSSLRSGRARKTLGSGRDDGNGNGISWECQNHEEAVSAQNYEPIIAAWTPECS